MAAGWHGRLGWGLVLLLGAGLSLGCPSTPQPSTQPPEGGTGRASEVPTVIGGAGAPSAAATAAASQAAASTPAISGSWRVHVRSTSPAIDPAMFDTPDKQAKVFFDHEARASGGRLTVEHKTLKRDWPVKDAALATKLDGAVGTLDWAKLAETLSAEKPTEGATVFHFTVSRGETTVELSTARIEEHPRLVEIVQALQQVTGVP